MITIILKIIFAWFQSFFTHEVMHCLEGIRQGSTEGTIRIVTWHQIPVSMRAGADYVRSVKMFSLAGGLYSGIVFLIVALISTDIEWQFSFGMVALVQFLYGPFETCCRSTWSSRMYLIGRCSIYILGSILYTAVWMVLVK